MKDLSKTPLMKDLVASNESIKTKRGNLVGSQIERAQKGLIDSYEEEILKCEEKLESLKDLSPTSTTSLRIGKGEDFDAQKYVNAIEDLNLQIIELNVRKQSAQKTYDAWFTIPAEA